MEQKETIAERFEAEATEQYAGYMRMATLSAYNEDVQDSLFLDGVAFNEQKSNEAVLRDFRDFLERNVLGSVVMNVLSEGSAREGMMELVKGSKLESLLPDIYAQWDETIGEKDLQEMLNLTVSGLEFLKKAFGMKEEDRSQMS